MTDPTPPAVSEAMREALSPDLASLLIDAGAAHLIGVQKFRQLLSFLVRPSGPIASEIARLTGDLKAAEDQNEALHVKLASLAPHGTCACSYDKPDDVCSHHSPALAAAEADLTRMRAETERRGRIDVFGIAVHAIDAGVSNIRPVARDDIARSISARVRDALSNPEQTDA